MTDEERKLVGRLYRLVNTCGNLDDATLIDAAASAITRIASERDEIRKRLEKELLDVYRERDAIRDEVAMLQGQFEKACDDVVTVRRELEACEGSLRNSGNNCRDLHAMCKEAENERDAARRLLSTEIFVPRRELESCQAERDAMRAERSMTETLMNPDEKKFWDAADAAADAAADKESDNGW